MIIWIEGVPEGLKDNEKVLVIDIDNDISIGFYDEKAGWIYLDDGLICKLYNVKYYSKINMP